MTPLENLYPSLTRALSGFSETELKRNTTARERVTLNGLMLQKILSAKDLIPLLKGERTAEAIIQEASQSPKGKLAEPLDTARVEDLTRTRNLQASKLPVEPEPTPSVAPDETPLEEPSIAQPSSIVADDSSQPPSFETNLVLPPLASTDKRSEVLCLRVDLRKLKESQRLTNLKISLVQGLCLLSGGITAAQGLAAVGKSLLHSHIAYSPVITKASLSLTAGAVAYYATQKAVNKFLNPPTHSTQLKHRIIRALPAVVALAITAATAYVTYNLAIVPPAIKKALYTTGMDLLNRSIFPIGIALALQFTKSSKV